MGFFCKRHKTLHSRWPFISAILFITVLAALSLATKRPSPPSMIGQPPIDSIYFEVATEEDENDKPFILECEASGFPDPEYKWFKNGQPFPFEQYDTRMSQQPGRGTIVITVPKLEDEGHYHCEATNEYGNSLSSGVFVRRSYLDPFADEPPIEMAVQEGEPLTLGCTPSTGFPKPTISWLILTAGVALKSINNSRITVDPEGSLHFSNVTASDLDVDSLYVCLTSTVISTRKYMIGNKVKLTGITSQKRTEHPPVKQYCSPPNIVALRGEAQDIHCIFGGTPLPEISWSKNNDRLDSDRYSLLNYGKTLRLDRVYFEDEGLYKCTASNGVGSNQSWISSIIVQSTPYWISAPNNTNAGEDESVRFECKASGEPEPSVKWMVNGVELSRASVNSRRKLISPTTLVIENLVKTDTAVYQCNASNIHGYAFRDFYLNVLNVAPEITMPPEELYEAVNGDSVTLRCRVFGVPQPIIKWKMDNEEVPDELYTVKENGDLLFSEVTCPYMGQYQCCAQNKYGLICSDESLGKLYVYDKTRILDAPKHHEKSLRGWVKLDCNVVADELLSYVIDWQFNGRSIDFDNNPRMRNLSDGGLRISEITALDSGVYTCFAKTRLDNVSVEHTMVVMDVPNAPRIVHVECKQKTASVEWLPMGDNRSPILSYYIQANTSFTPYTWRVIYRNIPASEFKLDVSLSPWANYSFQVIASNKIGSSEPSVLSSFCETPPDVPYSNPPIRYNEGTAPSKLVISWRSMPPINHNGPGFFYRVLFKPANSEMNWETVDIHDWQQTRLIVDNQPTYQPYDVRVEAHNLLGQANVEAEQVTIYSGKDSTLESPKGLKLVKLIDGNTAEITWNFIQGPIKGYKIQVWKNDSLEEMREMLVHPDANRYKVNILTPFSDNFVRVIAYNNIIEGPPSDNIVIRTPEGRPGPVASFDAIPKGSTVVRLEWRPPNEPNGILTGYQITIEQVNGSVLSLKDRLVFDSNARTTHLTGLEPKTKYRIYIRAKTQAGEGTSYFTETSTADKEPRQPGKPSLILSNLKTSKDGRAGVNVTRIPELNGHAGSHFFVEYKRKSDAQFKKKNQVPGEDTVSVTDLEPGILYQIRVTAVDEPLFTASDLKEFQTTRHPESNLHPSTSATLPSKSTNGTSKYLSDAGCRAVKWLFQALRANCFIRLPETSHSDDASNSPTD